MTNLQSLKNLAKKTVPSPMYRWIGSQLKGDRDRPPVGKVDFGDLRRVTPISRSFGYDRGQPVGLDYRDEQYPQIITVKATKPMGDGEDRWERFGRGRSI